MTGYLVNFAVYTMAMLGLIFFALMVYKKFSLGGFSNNSNSRYLSVEETISLAPRKTLYIVKAGNERFLIAGDIDKTTLISKLENNSVTNIKNQIERNETQYLEQNYRPQYENNSVDYNTNFQRINVTEQKRKTYENNISEFSSIKTFPQKANQQQNVLHDMLRKINK